jgi:hypothetical protein
LFVFYRNSSKTLANLLLGLLSNAELQWLKGLRNFVWFNIVKVHRPYSLSKDALREEGCLWLIKCLGHVSLNDVRHFNTPPHVWQLWSNTCSTSGWKSSLSSKELALIPYKSSGALLSKEALRDEGCLWLIKCIDHVSLGDVGHFNKHNYKRGKKLKA